MDWTPRKAAKDISEKVIKPFEPMREQIRAVAPEMYKETGARRQTFYEILRALGCRFDLAMETPGTEWIVHPPGFTGKFRVYGGNQVEVALAVDREIAIEFARFLRRLRARRSRRK